MDFLSGFKEPAVIISIAVSLFALLFSRQGAKAGDFLITLLGRFSSEAKSRYRLMHWNRRKKILLKIYNPHEVQIEISRTYCYLLMFVFSIVTYILLIAIGPLKDIGGLPTSVQYFIYSPVLAIEALWMLQREYMRSIVNASGRRVTSQLTARLRRRTH